MGDKPEKIHRCHFCRKIVDRNGYCSGLGRFGAYVCNDNECGQLADEEIDGAARDELEHDRDEFHAKHGQWP